MHSNIGRLKDFWSAISPWESKNAPAPVLPILVEKSEEQRKEILTRYLASEVARGGRVKMHTDFDAVLEFGRRPNHILHFLLCFPTVGFWIIVWVLLAMTMKITTSKYQVNSYGQLIIQ